MAIKLAVGQHLKVKLVHSKVHNTWMYHYPQNQYLNQHQKAKKSQPDNFT